MPSGQIIVADDDAAIRTVLNQALSRAGYEVRATGTVAGLWRWVAAGEGDLVITDVVMPDDNAFEILPRIRRMRPDLPIIVMSAQNTFMNTFLSRSTLKSWSRSSAALWPNRKNGATRPTLPKPPKRCR